MEYKTKNMNLQLFAGETITDLTGTSWLFNDTDITPVELGVTRYYGITFISNNINYFSITIGRWDSGDERIIDYDSTNVYIDWSLAPLRYWQNPAYKTIQIIGGTDATNQDLINWLQSNATQIQTGYESLITLTNCTCNKSSESSLSGSYSATITADDGYYLSSVTTTLGTATIATNKKTATIEIEDVTENFSIIGTGTAKAIKNVILHPDNNGVTDYTTDLLPKSMEDTTKITNYQEINRPNSMPTASATSPDFVQYNGKLYKKVVSGGVPSTITDLTGTTWIINSTTCEASYGGFVTNFSVNGIIPDSYTIMVFNIGYHFDSLQPAPDDISSQANTVSYWYMSNAQRFGNDIAVNDVIEFISGNDVTNANLISWLQSNATQQLPITYEYIAIQDELTTTSVSDGTINKNIGFDGNGNIVKAAPESIPSVTLTTTTGSEGITVDNSSLTLVTRDTAQTISGAKNFSTDVTFDNNKYIKGKVTGGTAYNLIGVNASNGLVIGNASMSVTLNTSSNVIPGANGTKDLGSSSYKWKDLYISGDLSDGTNSVSVANIEKTTNKVTSISSGSTNTQYPSALAVYNYAQPKLPAVTNDRYLHTNSSTGNLEWVSLTNVFTYIGTTTTALSDGSTTNPITINGDSVTAVNGNVVGYGNKEFVWNGSAWEELGDEGNATSSVYGKVKLGSDTTQTVVAENVSATASRTYAIQTNSNGQLVVNVPWENTTYTIPTITLNGSTTTSPSFYSPTTAGTNGQVLVSNGSGAPSWATLTINPTQDLTSNTAGTLDSTAWGNLKTNHYATISSPTMTGLNSTYEFVNIKLSINSTNQYVKLAKNTTNKYSGLFFIEESTNLYEITAYYNGTDIILRCATVM